MKKWKINVRWSKGNLKKNKIDVHEKMNEHKCLMCDKLFVRKPNLVRHMNLIHDYENQKKFKCDSCDKTCSTNANLSKHVDAVHRNLKNHKCCHCMKSFFAKSRLKNHVVDCIFNSIWQIEIQRVQFDFWSKFASRFLPFKFIYFWYFSLE